MTTHSSGGEFAFAVEWALFIEQLRSVSPEAAEYVETAMFPSMRGPVNYTIRRRAERRYAEHWATGERLSLGYIFKRHNTPQGAEYWEAINDQMGERRYEYR